MTDDWMDDDLGTIEDDDSSDMSDSSSEDKVKADEAESEKVNGVADSEPSEADKQIFSLTEVSGEEGEDCKKALPDPATTVPA